MSADAGDARAAGGGQPAHGRFNLSALAIRHPQLTLFFLLVVAIAGTLAFFKLGQREDPDFAFRAMVIRTIWPGRWTGIWPKLQRPRCSRPGSSCRTPGTSIPDRSRLTRTPL